MTYIYMTHPQPHPLWLDLSHVSDSGIVMLIEYRCTTVYHTTNYCRLRWYTNVVPLGGMSAFRFQMQNAHAS